MVQRAMPLCDCHAHTCDLSYCCDAGITIETYVRALRDHPECAGVAVTNHGFAAYFPSDLAWSWRFMTDPSLWDGYRSWGNQRLARHLDQIDAVRDLGVHSGLEVELMSDGRLTVDDALRRRLDVIIGSVHVLPEQFQDPQPPPEAVLAAWWKHTQRLASSGIDILGHPFRWLAGREGVTLTPELVHETVALARRAGIAVEINSHQVIDRDLDLLRECVAQGVPLAFGTDSHRREEILDLSYHRALVARAGLSLADLLLWRPSGSPDSGADTAHGGDLRPDTSEGATSSRLG